MQGAVGCAPRDLGGTRRQNTGRCVYARPVGCCRQRGRAGNQCPGRGMQGMLGRGSRDRGLPGHQRPGRGMRPEADRRPGHHGVNGQQRAIGRMCNRPARPCRSAGDRPSASRNGPAGQMDECPAGRPGNDGLSRRQSARSRKGSKSGCRSGDDCGIGYDRPGARVSPEPVRGSRDRRPSRNQRPGSRVDSRPVRGTRDDRRLRHKSARGRTRGRAGRRSRNRCRLSSKSA